MLKSDLITKLSQNHENTYTFQTNMKDIKSFTVEELTKFINSQSDDRPVDMNQPNGDYDCGCVLVHFGRHYFHRQIKGVSFNNIENDRKQLLSGEHEVFHLITFLVNRKPKNYGEVKRILKNYN